MQALRSARHAVAAAALYRISNGPGARRFPWDDKLRDLVSQSARMVSEEGIGLFGIRRRGRESPIGFCVKAHLAVVKELELAFGFTPGTWGQGLATEASVVCPRYLFERGVWSACSQEPIREPSLRSA